MSEERAGTPDPDDADELDVLDDLLGEEPDDADAGEDLPSEDDAEGDEPEPQPQPAPRSQRRIVALRNRLKQQEDENRQLRDRLFQTPAPVAAQPDPYRQAEIERQEAERVAQMMPHEMSAYYARKTEDRLSQQLLQTKVETRDMIDRQLFSGICQQEPTAQRLSGQVEQTLAQARQAGMNPTREAIYNLLLGNEVRARAKKQADVQRARGRRQIAAQTTQPGGGRSTAAAPRRRAADDSDAGLEDRLRRARAGDDW